MKSLIRSTALCAGILFGLVIDGALNQGLLMTNAAAIIGRPLTPVSVAGVARRTTRRMIYRTSVYVPVLPAGCTTIIVEGTTLQQCGGTYYQPYGNQYVIVNVN
jgi:hypothetical protein